MNDRTITAVRRQLWAMATERYDICIVRFLEDGGHLRQSLGLVRPSEIDKLLPKLVRQNARDENVLVRPDLALDRALVLIDDIEEMDVETLCDIGLEPCCVVETSPKNLQAWIDFGQEPMPVLERKILARWITGYVEADRGSADGQHYGRLAGFTNRKEKHFGKGRNGGFPYVLCRYADPHVCSKAQGARSWAHGQAQAELAKAEEQAAMAATQYSNRYNVASAGQASAPTVTQSGIDLTGIWNNRADASQVFQWYCEDWKKHPDHARRKDGSKDGSDDLSIRDYAVASRMLKEGFNRAEIVRVLTADAVRKRNPIAYAERTVSAVEKKLNNPY